MGIQNVCKVNATIQPLKPDGPSTALKRFATITPGGTYIGDFSYPGAVFIWSSTATAQSCEIREFIQ